MLTSEQLRCAARRVEQEIFDYEWWARNAADRGSAERAERYFAAAGRKRKQLENLKAEISSARDAA